MKVAILYNSPMPGKPDSEDVLEEVSLVAECLGRRGYGHCSIPVKGGVSGIVEALSALRAFAPEVVFNLVETMDEDPRGLPAMAALLELSGLPHTGSPYDVLLTSTDKALSKLILESSGIPTPAFSIYPGVKELPPFPVIAKPAWEDASVGIDDASVFHAEKPLADALPVIYGRHGGQKIIIEEFIDGREFNIAVLEAPDGSPEPMPLAEMTYQDWPDGKPRIIGYAAKWEPESFEYANTVRAFNPPDAPLEAIRSAALRSWEAFGFRGYARVDMRLSADGTPKVIEVNANPCIAPDSGFISAAKQAGYSEAEVIERILRAAIRRAKAG